MTHRYQGTCACNSVKLTVELPEPIERFTPRACDCDFCTIRKIEYLSHPQGALTISSPEPLNVAKQGSGNADFLTCIHCQTVVAASLERKGGRIGALNARLLDDYNRLSAQQVVSPKKLSSSEKLARWNKIWFPIVIHST